MGTTREADPMRTQPAPMVGSTATAPTTRVRDLTWSYDWLGNMTEWGDDQSDFYERSIGDIRNGYGDGDHRPSALYFSANLGGLTPTDRGGYVELDYGEGGNALSMTVHGDCVDRGSAMCDAPQTPYGDPAGGSSSSARLAAARAHPRRGAGVRARELVVREWLVPVDRRVARQAQCSGERAGAERHAQRDALWTAQQRRQRRVGRCRANQLDRLDVALRSAPPQTVGARHAELGFTSHAPKMRAHWSNGMDQ